VRNGNVHQGAGVLPGRILSDNRVAFWGGFEMVIEKIIGRGLRGLAVFAAVVLGTPAAQADGFGTIFFDDFEQPANFASPLGTNLDGVVDYSTSYNFVDVMKQSRGWITQDTTNFVFDTGEEACLDLDAHGYLRSLDPVTSRPGCGATSFNAVATLFFFGDFAGHYPSGQYIVTWDGTATIEYQFAAQKNAGLSTPQRDVVDVDSSQGGWLMRFTAIDPGDPPHNIHVWMPGYDEHTGPSQLFHPDFLSLIRRFKVLRFMDWMQTNNSTQQDFADRPTLDDIRWTEGGGVPVEMMVELANRNRADPWFNMPAMATDDYITQFALLVRHQLMHNRKVYVEYSNEVWNGIFAQGDYVQAQGQAEYGNVDSPFTLRINWHGERTAQMCDLWKTAWGSEANRVACVLGAQAANTWTATEAADCPLWTAGKPCSGHGIAAVAIAPYFGNYMGSPDAESTVEAWTLDDLFAEINSGGQLSGGPTGGALAESGGWMADQATAAAARDLELVSYEGGQHLVGVGGVENNDTITALFNSANRDARMGTAYTSYLNSWRTQGGHLFMHFSSAGDYSKFGNWGAVEYLDEQNTPKQQALMDFIDANPCWWTGCSD
jgi:hypothetical protein